MGKDNEELKNDLRNGSSQFGSAATTLQGIEDAIKQVMTDLSPTTKTWDGQASTASNEDLKELTEFTTTGKEVLQKTSDGLISLVGAIEDAEKEAADEAKKADVANDLILVLGVVLLPVAAGAVGGALAAEEGASLLNKAIQLLRDADTKMAGVLDEARALVQKIPTLFTDIKTVDEIPEVSELPAPAPAAEIPVEPPAPVQEPAPPAEGPAADASPGMNPDTPGAPESAPPAEVPATDANPDMNPDTPGAPESATPAEGPATDANPDMNPDTPHAETPVKEANKRDSGFGDGPFEMPGKPGESPTELPKEIAPQKPVEVYTVHTDVPDSPLTEPEYPSEGDSPLTSPVDSPLTSPHYTPEDSPLPSPQEPLPVRGEPPADVPNPASTSVTQGPGIGDVTTTITSSDGSVTTTVLDTHGNVINTTIDAGTVTETVTDPFLNETVTVTDPLGNSTVTVTDPDGNVVSVTTVTNKTDAFGNTTTIEEVTGGSGNVVSKSIDFPDGDKAFSATNPDGSSTTINLSVDDNGNTIQTEVVTNSNGEIESVTTTSVEGGNDAYGNPITTETETVQTTSTDPTTQDFIVHDATTETITNTDGSQVVTHIDVQTVTNLAGDETVITTVSDANGNVISQDSVTHAAGSPSDGSPTPQTPQAGPSQAPPQADPSQPQKRPFPDDDPPAGGPPTKKGKEKAE